jgi:rhamnosyltransferase subunit B
MKSGATILLAWELGDGMGHVGRLLSLAERFAAEGFKPVFAVRDAFGTMQRLRKSRFPVVQAPLVTSMRTGEGGFFARSFADILGVIGFGDIERMRAATHVWRSLVDLVQPALVVGDFSPVLALALARREIPMLVVGSGFAVPPAELAEFPDINPSGKSSLVEADLLAIANRLLVEEGRAEVDSLPALVGGDGQCVCTWPRLDPYATHRREAALGPMAPSPPQRARPTGAPSWFAYVAADSPMAESLLDGLVATKIRGAAFIRKASDALVAKFESHGHVLHRSVPPLEEMLATASVIIHHGGINTAETALAMGVPQMIVSRHLEQHLTGAAVAAIGAGRAVRGRFDAAVLAEGIDRMARNVTMARAAERAAGEITDRRGALDQVVSRAIALAETRSVRAA